MEVNLLTYNTHGLPWSRNTTKEICAWISAKQPHIVCLQEVFTVRARKYYVKMLNHAGYTVLTPDDEGVTLLPSGLLTAFLRANYDMISSVFCPYIHYHNVEIYANKGFHLLRLQQRNGLPIIIINTHTQSETEAKWIFGKKSIDAIRFQQIQQILDFVQCIKTPVLVCGDLNCEHSPHSELRFLTPLHQNLFKKATFYSSGEDIDHVGWLLRQYAREGCHTCDVERYGPVLKGCQIYQLPYSDHAPVEYDISIPVRKP